MKDLIRYVGKNGTQYDSWEELVAAEANGYAIAVLLSLTTAKGRERIVSRLQGIYPDAKTARTRANSVRAKIKREIATSPYQTTLLGVHVEPIWHEFTIN